jgi:hypothetical protein
MTQLWSEGEPITVAMGSRGQPVRFIWQGRPHPILRIVQHWQLDQDWWSEQGHLWREYLAVLTATGLFCVIFQDLADQHWYLVRVYD